MISVFFNFLFLYFFDTFSCVVFLYTEKSLVNDMGKGNNFSLLLVHYCVTMLYSSISLHMKSSIGYGVRIQCFIVLMDVSFTRFMIEARRITHSNP